MKKNSFFVTNSRMAENIVGNEYATCMVDNKIDLITGHLDKYAFKTQKCLTYIQN